MYNLASDHDMSLIGFRQVTIWRILNRTTDNRINMKSWIDQQEDKLHELEQIIENVKE